MKKERALSKDFEVETTGFYIVNDFYGDEAHLAQTWELVLRGNRDTAGFIFTDAQELADFKKALADAFEIATGERCIIETIEEAEGREVGYDPFCKCGNPSGNAYYVKDGQDTQIYKHHWRCSDCRGVLQIG